MKIGIIREGKVPPDSRVPLSPNQCKELLAKFPQLDILVQPSPNRCFKDEEYEAAGLQLQEDLSDRELLLGVKEVPINQLIPNKKYCFFSHTIKEQPYNRKLLQAIIEKNIQLLDYEVLTDESGKRVIAFGRFAGIAGAHNGLMTYGNRTKAYDLPQMIKFKDMAEATAYYKTVNWPSMKVVLTGAGRVANGAAEVLENAGFQRLSPQEFLNNASEGPVFTQLACEDYVAPKAEGANYDQSEFFAHPERYTSIFDPYTKVADLMINGIYWDNRAPQFFTAEEMKAEDFKIQVIADVTCDIAPAASIPSTLYASTIAEPVFGYDPKQAKAVAPYAPETIDMMTIDNLPNELPRDASMSFGEQFIASVLPEFLGLKDTKMIERASVTLNGQLGPHFQYLTNYLNAE